MHTPTFRRAVLCATLVSAAFACRPGAPPRAVYPLANVHEVDTLRGTVSIPVHSGRVGKRLVWYIVTESSNEADARRRGVTWAPRLSALAGTAAAQPGRDTRDGIAFSAGVDFTPEWAVKPAPDSGFPAFVAEPGSVAEPGYSPFVQFADGTIVNAPIIADEHRLLDRVVALDVGRMRAVLRLGRGYAAGRDAWYISTDASDPMVAAFERSTWVPNLATAPTAAASGSGSARFGIVAVANGPTGRANPERQGMRSMLLDGLAPLNVLQGAPDTRAQAQAYSPLWDLHLVQWTAAAIAADNRVKVITFDEARVYAERGWLVSAMPGSPNALLGGLNAVGVAINCPVMATFARSPSR